MYSKKVNGTYYFCEQTTRTIFNVSGNPQVLSSELVVFRYVFFYQNLHRKALLELFQNDPYLKSFNRYHGEFDYAI